MANFSNDEKIKKYLDELADEYKELIYKKLIEDNKGVDELSISKLLRIDSEIKKPLVEKSDRRKHLLNLMVITGVCYAVVGLCMFLFYSMRNTYDSVEFVSLLVTLLGILIALVSAFLPKVLPGERVSINSKYGSEKIKEQIEYQIVTIWRDFEGITNDLTERNTSNSKDTPIDILKSNNLIGEDEISCLRALLKLRNTVVHGNTDSIDIAESRNVLNKCSVILAKLEKIL